MRIYPNQLTQYINKYDYFLIQGEEPFQKEETLDCIKKYFKNKECLTFTVTNDFDFSLLESNFCNFSLFSEEKLIIIHFEKTTKELTNILTKYATENSDKKVVLFTTNNVTKTSWFKKIEKLFLNITTYYLKENKHLNWIQQRVEQYKLQISPKKVNFLAKKTEGNLLIADQIIRQTSFIGGQLQDSAVSELLSEYTQFNVFDLIDAALKKEPKRALSILESLLKQKTELSMILWAITKETKLLINLMQSTDKATLFKSNQIWPKRQKIITASFMHLKLEYLLEIMQIQMKAEIAIKSSQTTLAKHLIQNSLMILSGLKQECYLFNPNDSEAIL